MKMDATIINGTNGHRKLETAWESQTLPHKPAIILFVVPTISVYHWVKTELIESGGGGMRYAICG